MQIYLHRKGSETTLTDVDGSSTTVGGLVTEHLGAVGAAWLEDDRDPLDPDSTLEQAGVKERSHVHVSTCKKVDVRVRYGGDAVTKEFPPAAKVQALFEWATGPKGFELTPAEKAKHALGICDTTTEADKADHVGSFADDDCSACFDLAPKERFEGAI